MDMGIHSFVYTRAIMSSFFLLIASYALYLHHSLDLTLLLFLSIYFSPCVAIAVVLLFATISSALDEVSVVRLYAYNRNDICINNKATSHCTRICQLLLQASLPSQHIYSIPIMLFTLTQIYFQLCHSINYTLFWLQQIHS